MRVLHRAILRVAGIVPPGIARRISALQFRSPYLRRLITWTAAELAGRRVVISGGAARGLSIAALDTNLGYRIGTTEPALQQFLVDHLTPGDVFYDLGANVGFFSLIACRCVGPTGRVVAVEPLPAVTSVLRANLEANGFAHAMAVEAAIGSAAGRASFRPGSSSLDGRLSAGGDGLPVEVVSIDHGVERLGWPLPNVIKLDVEGAEADAIRGMRRTVARSRPTLLIEVHWCRDAVVEALEAIDYMGEPFGEVDVLAAANEVHGMLLALPVGSRPCAS